MNINKLETIIDAAMIRPDRLKPMTDEQIQTMVRRVTTIQDNRTGESPGRRFLLIGILAALRAVRGEDSKVDELVMRAEMDVHANHKFTKPEGCSCAVCELFKK